MTMGSKLHSKNPWREMVQSIVGEIAAAAKIPREEISECLEIPPDSKMGDLACTIAFQLAKIEGKNPVHIANEIAEELRKDKSESSYISRIEVKGPYINIFLNKGIFTEMVLSSVVGLEGKYGKTQEFSNRRVMIEFPAVNPSKPWHIGHARNAVLGDTLGNLLTATGHDVTRIDYINDLGLQIAQLTWKLLQPTQTDAEEKYDWYLGRQYVDVQEAFQEDPEVEKEVREIARQLEDLSSRASRVSTEMVTKCVKAQNQTAYTLGIYHDYQVWESTLSHSGLLSQAKEMVLEAESIFVMESGEKEGCVVARLDSLDEFKEMKDPLKVLFRSDGTRTYTGADVALQMWKFGILSDPFRYSVFEMQPNGKRVYRTALDGEKRDLGTFDSVFNVIGAAQAHPQRLIYAILELLGYEEESTNSHHVAYEFVGLEDEDFSGRKGTWIGYSADEVIEKAKTLAKKEVAKRNPEEDEEFFENVASRIAAGAVRYFLLNASPDRKITFRWSEALDFNGDAAPYLQYSLARAQRILEKQDTGANQQRASSVLSEDAEFELVKSISRLADEIIEVVDGLKKHTWGTSFQTSRITAYCYQLATQFSKFYDTCPVLQADEEVKQARLYLVKAFKIAMTNCLRLLGIPIIERM